MRASGVTQRVRNGAILGLLLAFAVGVLLVDLYLFPGVVLPAIVYALAILVATFLLPPRMVAGLSVCVLALQGVSGWLERSPEWLFALDLAGIAAFGYLATALVYRVERESELVAQVRAAASELEVQHGRLQAVLQQMPAGVVIAEAPSGRLVLTNARAEQIWGRRLRPGTGPEGYGDGYLFHPDGRPYRPDETPLARSLDRGGVVTGEEAWIVRGDGTESVVRINSAPIRDREGRILAAVAVFDDITDLKQAQAERDRLLAEEQRKTVELNTTICSIADGLIIYAPTGEIVRMNGAAKRMLGLSERQRGLGVAERLLLLRVETPEGREITEEECPAQRALRGETSRGVILVMHPPDGKPLWVSVSAAPMQGPNGKRLGAVAIFTDITQLHDLQESREDDVRMISHDLRTPLTPILGQASLLHRLLAERGLTREADAAEAIVKSARQMDSMIQELVESARLETGRLELREEPTELCPFIRDVSRRIGTEDERKRLRVECRGDLPAVPVDRQRLERVIWNLVTNAFKYSYAAAPVVVRAERRDGTVVVSVIDRGVGIPQDELPHVFERLYRARTGRAAEGLGLGLYISRLIVEAHGGRIWAESRVGEGSTFSFSLPIARSR